MLGRFRDTASTSGVIEYITNLSPAQVTLATSSGWRFTLMSRMVSDSGSAAAHSMAFGNGTRRFYIFFDLNAAGQLTAQLLGGSVYTLTATSAAATNFHLHELIFNPASLQASYYFDRRFIAAWPGQASAGQSNQVMWGANASSGRGVMNYHRAEFEIAGEGILASYSAGLSGGAPRPPPASQGWTRFVTGSGVLESIFSPDAVYLPPEAITDPVTFVRPGQATLNGSINAYGAPTFYWFEHGPTTNYGRFTVTNTLAAGTEFAPVMARLTALPRGGQYHYQLIASSAAGQLPGGNRTFSVPQGVLVTSGGAGSGALLNIVQPSLELNFIISTNGSFPARETNVPFPFLGEVRLFAGNFAPAGWSFCHGQLLDVSNHWTLFAVLGTSHGGDGEETFGLPDLRGRTFLGTGSGPDGEIWNPGEQGGLAETFLFPAQMPVHSHSLTEPLSASQPAGAGQPRLNLQPSLALACLLNFVGQFPGSEPTSEPVLTEIALSAAQLELKGWTPAWGQLWPINQHQALFALMGTSYGGNGQTTFAIPDLRGRTPMGTGAGPGPASWQIGNKTGSVSPAIALSQLPSHQHEIPGGGLTGGAGSNQPLSLMQPSLAINYLIATVGEVPSTSVPATNRMIGEIGIYAGTVLPAGWIPCDGRLLAVAEHPGLFGAIGTTFGGDGVANFAVPDLSGRIPVGSPTGQPGASFGAQETVLTLAQMPAHTHALPTLDFDRWLTSFGLKDADAEFAVDFDGDGFRNGFEWATGSDPTNAASLHPLTIRLDGSDVILGFSRNTKAADIVLSVQRSGDLAIQDAWMGIATNSNGSWLPGVAATESGVGNTVDVSIADAQTNAPAASYRLKVEWP